MGRIDVYLRSIERFGAAGAVLTSGQAVMLRFPTGDRHATQVTPHDQLVALIRECAPPPALGQIDANRPARFEIDSGAMRYAISVAPRPNAWQVVIEPAQAGSGSQPMGVPTPATGSGPKGSPRVSQQMATTLPPNPYGGQPPLPPMGTPTFGQRGPGQSNSAVQQMPQGGQMDADEPQQESMFIERGQYDAPTGTPKSSGSALLDLLTSQARAANASDLILTSGSAAFMRVNGQLTATNARSAIDGDLLSRELGVVAPPEVRSDWIQKGTAMFTYGDGLGRVRVTLTRDHRGPGASLRLLVGEPPTLEELGLAEVDHWLDDRGLILIGGPSGAGKTTTLAAMVRGIGEHRRRVVALEDPIEIVHVSPWISQRAIREHVPNVTAGVEAAMREGVDAIVIGSATTPESAAAVIEAAIGGHLVITTVVSPTAEVAADRLIDRLPEAARKGADQVINQMLLGRMAPVIGLDGERTFEVVLGPPRR